jgi:hypothetical protein
MYLNSFIRSLWTDTSVRSGFTFRKETQNKAIYKYVRVTNGEDIKYCNYLQSREDWESVYQQTTIDTAHKVIATNPYLLF